MVKVDNNRLAVLLMSLSFGMLGMAYAAVPLYQLFCQVTGFGGTTQIAETTSGTVIERRITVRFSANTHREMPWEFRPVQSSQELKIGEQALAFFEAVNHTDKILTGTATFNVTPHKAGPYFVKIECFCFTEQTLQPGQRVDMPVTYYIDPEIANDPNLEEVTEVTLSYTFFLKDSDDNGAAPVTPTQGK